MTKEQAIDLAREVRTYYDRFEELYRTIVRNDWAKQKENFGAMQAGCRAEAMDNARGALWGFYCTLTAQFDLDDKVDLGFAKDATE